MTDFPSVEELREWFAKDLMEAVETVKSPMGQLHYRDKAGKWHLSQPDDPTNGQIWKVVEKMREPRKDGSSGFNFNFNWQQLPEIKIALAQFHRISGGLEHGQGADEEPCLAILKAAYATCHSTKWLGLGKAQKLGEETKHE